MYGKEFFGTSDFIAARKCYNPISCLRTLLALLLLALALLGAGRHASAVCATAKIQIDQDMAFERQAFEARMTLDNGLPDTALTDFTVTLQFLDQNKAVVPATTASSDALSLSSFLYRVDGAFRRIACVG